MALDSPYTGIVDWRLVALQYGKDFVEAGGEVVTDCEVNDISTSTESPAGSAEGSRQRLIASVNATLEELFNVLHLSIRRDEISHRNQRQKGKNLKNVFMRRL